MNGSRVRPGTEVNCKIVAMLMRGLKLRPGLCIQMGRWEVAYIQTWITLGVHV